MVELEIVDENEYPRRQRTSKYTNVIDAVTSLQQGSIIKMKSRDVKIGSLRSLLQKEDGKFGVAEKAGFVYIRRRE